MDINKKIKNDHDILSQRIETYIKNIKEVYGKYMGIETLQRLDKITNYGNHVIINKNGNINAHANSNGVYLPVEAYFILSDLQRHPIYGTDKSHKLYNNDTLVINDNTFYDYIEHVLLTGSTPLDYYEDLLLHETMHFCGSGGASSLKEGINEYLTRKIAQKKGFRTNACGYPKEVKLVHELEKIFGEEIINSIAFINDNNKVLEFLKDKLGDEAKILYNEILEKTKKEFHDKYYIYMNEYNGLSGIKQKALNYEKIDYSEVYSLINQYKNKKLSKK